MSSAGYSVRIFKIVLFFLQSTHVRNKPKTIAEIAKNFDGADDGCDERAGLT